MVRAHWKSVALFAAAGAIVGGITALLLPPVYRSGAVFQAETNSFTPIGGPLVGIAARQANPQFFGDLLTTDAVLRRVAEAEQVDIQELRQTLKVDVNLRTGVVRFTLGAGTPQRAKALAERSLAALGEVSLALRQASADPQRAFIAQRAARAREELRAAEQALQTFVRGRTGRNLAATQLDEAQLRGAVDVAQQVYLQLRLQEEGAAVEDARNTPVISVIDPPVLPARPDRPRRRLAVLVGLLIGLSVALVRLLLEGERRRFTAPHSRST